MFRSAATQGVRGIRSPVNQTENPVFRRAKPDAGGPGDQAPGESNRKTRRFFECLRGRSPFNPDEVSDHPDGRKPGVARLVSERSDARGPGNQVPGESNGKPGRVFLSG